MPTAALTPTAKFARPEAVAADVSIATEAAYSTLGVAIADDDAKMGVQTVKALSKTAKFATAVAAAADVPVTTAAVAASSTYAAAVDFAAAVASVAAVAAPAVTSVGKEGVNGYMLHEFIHCMNSYFK
jgi:hypothetical protein